MLHAQPPQPRLPTPTVFDGTSPTFPEWARELRACLNISHFEYINLFDFAYEAEEPLTTDIMVLQTATEARQGAEILRHRARTQALQTERELPQGDRREHAVIAPRTFADHVPLQPHYTQLSLSTATNQPIHIYGYKDILLVCNNIPVRFYICDVKAPLLGLRDIFDSGIILHINGKDNSSVEHQGENEPLYHHRSHLFIDIWLLTSITEHITIGFSTFNNMVSTMTSTSS